MGTDRRTTRLSQAASAALVAVLALVPTYAETQVVKKGETVTVPFDGYLIENKVGRECVLCQDLLKVSRDRRQQCEESRVTEKCDDGPSAFVWTSIGGFAGAALALLVIGLAR